MSTINIEHIVIANCLKDENKEKEAGNGPLKRLVNGKKIIVTPSMSNDYYRAYYTYHYKNLF